MIKIIEKKKNPNYNNTIHIPEAKWKWTINATTNRDISEYELERNTGGFQTELSKFESLVFNKNRDDKILGISVAEVQNIGGKLHYHSIWGDIQDIDNVVKVFNENTGTNKIFINSKIEKYTHKFITEKDYIWYIFKNPLGVKFTDQYKRDVLYYRSKITEIEVKLKSKPDYFISAKFNHLKNFISKEGNDKNTENHLRYILKQGNPNE